MAKVAKKIRGWARGPVRWIGWAMVVAVVFSAMWYLSSIFTPVAILLGWILTYWSHVVSLVFTIAGFVAALPSCSQPHHHAG